VEEEVHILIRCKKLELVRKKSISKIKDKYKALANCNSEELTSRWCTPTLNLFEHFYYGNFQYLNMAQI
jgi:hypothetical protein